jgi:ATP-dependent DNA helicase RecG
MKYRKTTDYELAFILEEGEGYTLEFKQNINEDLPKELVAFANASGGRILIGVNDRNQVTSTDLSNRVLSKIEDMAAACDPPVTVQVEKLQRHGILIIHVPEGTNRPHRCNKGFYLSNGIVSQKMSTQDITAFIQAEGKIRFEQQLRLDLDWEKAIDEKRLEYFLSLAKITPKPDRANLLFNLGAGDFKDGRFYLHKTGVLFFSKEPTKRMLHVSVICALFKGAGRTDILDRKELTGNLPENVEDTLIFLKKHLKLRWEITTGNARRKEILELPEVALREAVINAVCHRDYNEEGANVMVEIFDDRVEICNPGGLTKGLSEKDFGRRSVCRNPNIAALLLRCNYIEKMGTGIERIKAALERERCPEVKISFNTMFCLEFTRPTYERVLDMHEITRIAASEKMSEKTPDRILRLVSVNKTITISELAHALGVTPRTIERNIKMLQSQGLLRRVGPDKGGYWDVIKKVE